jgi:hypothetical protein
MGGPARLAGLGAPGGVGGPVRLGGVGGPGGMAPPAHLVSPGGLGSLAWAAAAAERPSTVAVNRHALASQASRVRENFNHHDCFRGNWWDRHRGGWRAARWAAAGAAAGYGAAVTGGGGDEGGYAYSTPTWGDTSSYGGYASEPAYYDYGSNVVYEGNNVYVNGDAAATQEQYGRQASILADTGKAARASDEEEWLPLGVFAMVQGEQVNGNDLFQLAVNKSGVIRGNYYNALSDTALPVYGFVDKKTQRAAWTVGDRKEPVFEAGIANLTRSETTMLVHYGGGRAQQWTLVRVNQPAGPK